VAIMNLDYMEQFGTPEAASRTAAASFVADLAKA